MEYELEVVNIKCGGCANTIVSRLSELQGIDRVSVEVESGIVRVDGDQASRGQVTQELARLGYPEAGSVEGLEAVKAKAKSFVSCTIGRVEGRKN